LPSLPAFWVGILYDNAALDAAWDIVKDWNAEERQKLRDDVPTQGFAATIRNRTMLSLAEETLKLAREGLTRRRRLNAGGEDEAKYLEPLDDLVSRGSTPAEELLAKYHGSWGGSVEPVFSEYAY
jgi:glutamate--cysteine ligase